MPAPADPPPRVSDDAIRPLLGPAVAVDACRRAFEAVGRGDIDNPPREETVDERDGQSHFRLDMPAEWPDRWRSRKVVEETSDVSTGRLGERDAWIDLEDLQSARRWRLDAGHITDMRTGAAAALAAHWVGGEVRRLALIGTGRVARCVARACAVLFDGELRATSRSADNREAFAADVAGDLGDLRLTMVDSLEECVAGADVVLTAVPTPTPILSLAALPANAGIVAVAGDSRTRQLQAEVLAARPVLVDLQEQALRSGELRHAGETKALASIRWACRADGQRLSLPDVAAGAAAPPGAVAYLTGLAAQDLCCAVVVCDTLGD
jgi:alanine dehydrogenase